MSVILGNHWAFFAILSVIVMVIVGLRQYDIEYLEMRRRYSWKRFRAWSVVLGSVFTIIVMAESSRGIVQMLDGNIISCTDSTVWSVYLMPFAAMSAGAILALILYFIGVGAGKYSRKVVEERKLSPRPEKLSDGEKK